MTRTCIVYDKKKQIDLFFIIKVILLFFVILFKPLLYIGLPKLHEIFATGRQATTNQSFKGYDALEKKEIL